MMLNIPTLDKLKTLKLNGMAKVFEEQLTTGGYDLTFEERLGFMVDREYTERENRRLQSRIGQAKLRQQACLEGFRVLYFRAPRLFNDLAIAQADGSYNKIHQLHCKV